MSSIKETFKAGESRGTGSAKAEQCMDSVRDTLGSAKDKAADAAGHAQEQKEEAAGFLQQTGEQIKDMAQGAVDSVKNTLGVGDNNNNSRRPGSNV